MEIKNFDDNLMTYMFSSSYKTHKANLENKVEAIDDLTEKQAMEVANEMLNVLSKHNLSYKNAYRISLALTAALASGSIELYKNETE